MLKSKIVPVSDNEGWCIKLFVKEKQNVVLEEE
jgi:hypothetical protein